MTRIYLRPTAFVDPPAVPDARVDRLAGGPLHFAAYELIATADGRRIRQELVPAAAIGNAIAALPDAQAMAAARMRHRLLAPRAPIEMRGRPVAMDAPQVMAILNMTPDSFSDGGRHLGDAGAAAAAGLAMVEAGASIIDIGGESTRPGAETITDAEEIARTRPLIERLSASAAISIDTRKAAVMEAALAAGAGLVNDVASLLFDDRALDVVVTAGCPVVLMHFPGTAHAPHAHAGYGDTLIEVYDWLDARVAAVETAGVPRERIIVDPGIGFGKSPQENMAIIDGLALFHGLGCPVLLGASRKRLIGALAGEAPADRRLGGSIALALKGAAQGAQLLRVHDAFETVQALRVWRGGA